jgi:hypothetical protein
MLIQSRVAGYRYRKASSSMMLASGSTAASPSQGWDDQEPKEILQKATALIVV